MIKELVLTLARPAQAGGGDRYEADIGEKKPFATYFPQEWSRDRGRIRKAIKMTLEEVA